jgi:ribosomal protein S18 acetylase RimI-like enzyme
MLRLRRATPNDLDFLAEVDRVGEDPAEAPTEPHREAMAAFLVDPERAAWVYEDDERRVGLAACVFRRWPRDRPVTHGIFDDLDPAVFPAEGRFCEIFQLWVDPAYRRRGLATHMKREMEAECARRGVHMIYTHTMATNEHVIALQHKLGYREIQRGPIWDPVVRARFVKDL